MDRRRSQQQRDGCTRLTTATCASRQGTEAGSGPCALRESQGERIGEPGDDIAFRALAFKLSAVDSSAAEAGSDWGERFHRGIEHGDVGHTVLFPSSLDLLGDRRFAADQDLRVRQHGVGTWCTEPLDQAASAQGEEAEP